MRVSSGTSGDSCRWLRPQGKDVAGLLDESHLSWSPDGRVGLDEAREGPGDLGQPAWDSETAVGGGSWCLTAVGDSWRRGAVSGLQCGQWQDALEEGCARPSEKEDLFLLLHCRLTLCFNTELSPASSPLPGLPGQMLSKCCGLRGGQLSRYSGSCPWGHHRCAFARILHGI